MRHSVVIRRVLVSALAAMALLLAPLPASAQPVTGNLTFFKNYFVTGDYVVNGVGLTGKGVVDPVTGVSLATGNIPIAGVPDKADILAAYLYWQVVSTDKLGPDSGSVPATFKGYALKSEFTNSDGSKTWLPYAKALGSGTAPCWSSGGSTGGSSGTKYTYTYRADVLRFFDVGPDGKLVVNDSHQVRIPDSGSNGNALPIGLGASLVIVYRDATNLSLPLSAIVIYDGGYTLDNNKNKTMSQTVKGFYDPATTANAKMTHIVGSGQANKGETLTIGSASYTNVFVGALGDHWDTVTFPSPAFPPSPLTSEPFVLTGDSITTSVPSSSDCLTWGAVILKTDVKDQDGDGLLDKWETETTSPILNPNGQPLPNFYAMGARRNSKDLFVEIGYMTTGGSALTYGLASADNPPKPAHDHLPGHEALKLVGDAFRNAPATNPDGSSGIRVHFDVGVGYPAGAADDYIIRGTDPLTGASLARGGEAINETATQCTPGANAPVWQCQYAAYPGTVGWKTGFKFLRDQLLNPPAFNVDGTDPCDTPGNDGPGQRCERRFDSNRRATFHYALFAHSVGLPKSDQPCLETITGADGNPVNKEVPVNDVVNGRCVSPRRDNPDFHVPRTQTGIGDFPGGDVLVTMGWFPNNSDPKKPVGTPFMQGSTLMHELGHNLERRHGGESFEPNCKPNYFSVMNYLYQLRGLVDKFGVPYVDFSRSSVSPVVDETNVLDGTMLFGWPTDGTPRYRAGWYAPVTQDSYLWGPYTAGLLTRARRHCDGSEITETTVPWVRVDARDPDDPIDWNATLGLETSPLDINFNGLTTLADGSPQTLRGSDDWATIRLNQVGGRRQVGGLYIDKKNLYDIGPLSLDTGRGDGGRGDGGSFDLGRGDGGVGDFSRGDLGRGDGGRGDGGRGDGGRGDGGRGDGGRGDGGGGDLFGGPGPCGTDNFCGDPNNPGGELDFETATDLAKTPPTEFRACVIGEPTDPSLWPDTATCPGSEIHRIRTEWKAPNVGGATGYILYRVDDATLESGKPWNQVAALSAGTYFAVDSTELANGSQYTYFAVATYPPEPDHPVITSDPSNQVTITGINSPPTAVADAYATDEDTALTVGAPGVLGNDQDPDSAGATFSGAVLVPGTGPSHGTVTLSGKGSFSYTPTANYNGSDSFTYIATATYAGGTVTTAPGTVTITINPVNDPPVAASNSFATREDTQLLVSAPGVLTGATDIDSSSLTAVLATGPSHAASFSLSADGSFSYTPALNYSGSDSFTYKANDGSLESNVATATITVAPVNDRPVANPDSYTVVKDGTLSIAAPGVLANDTDVDSPSLTAIPATGPSHGGLTLNSNGSFTYTPVGGYVGPDSFTYKVNDGTDDSTVATVSLTVLTYTLVGIQNVPPATITKSKAGSTVPMSWQYKSGTTVVDSAQVKYSISVYGPLAGSPQTYTFSNTDSGSSNFRYDATTKTWYFNLQTKSPLGVAYPVGTYNVTITPTPSGYLPPNPTPFTLTLTK